MYTKIVAQVFDQTLRVTNIPKLASGGENEVRVEVTFDSLWAGFGKTAIFYRENKKNQVYHVVMKSDSCIVPREVMVEPGVVCFGILGTSGATVRTTEVVALTVAQGAITGLSSFEPMPNVYKQILSGYGELSARVNNFVTAGSTGNEELVDVRVGADGTAYPNAGTAVRQQISKLSDQTSAALAYYVEEQPIQRIVNSSQNVDGISTFVRFDYTLDAPLDPERVVFTVRAGNAEGDANRVSVKTYIYVGETIAQLPEVYEQSFPVGSDSPITHTATSIYHGVTRVVVYLYYHCNNSADTANVYYYPESVSLEIDGEVIYTEPTVLHLTSSVVTTETRPPVMASRKYVDSQTQTVGQNGVRGYMHKVFAGETARIKLLGDSITHGMAGTGFVADGEAIPNVWGSDLKQNPNGYCWANLLRDYVQAKFPAATVVNYAQSGWSSRDIVTNLPVLVEDADDVVICMIGTNDRGTGTLAQYRENLATICRACKDRGKPLILVASCPASVSRDSLTDAGGEFNFHMEDVSMAVQDIGYVHGVPTISLYQGVMEYCQYDTAKVDALLRDGLHPNDTGYRVLYTIIANALGFTVRRSDATWA